MHLFGAGFIIISSLLAGVMAGQEQMKRIRQLEQLRYSFELLIGEIRLTEPIISALFTAVGEKTGGTIGGLWLAAGESMNSAALVDPLSALRQAFEREKSVSPEIMTLLIELGGCLGRYDAEKQVQSIQYLTSKLDEIIEKYKADWSKNNRVRTCASASVGLSIVILMM